MMLSSNSLPSQIVVGLVLSLTSIGVGYQLGALTTRDTKSPPTVQKQEPEITLELEEEEPKVEEEEEEPQAIPDGDLLDVPLGFHEPCKMVLVVRTDLKLTPAEIATHQATLTCYKVLQKKNHYILFHWEYEGQAKIALKAKSEEQLLELETLAKSFNLCARSVRDPITNVRNVLAIGPGPIPMVNAVTGKLRLL